MVKSSFLKEEINDDETQHIVRMLVVESEQKYKSLVENALVGIYIITESRILYANPYLLGMIGYTADEIEEISLKDVIAPRSWSTVSDRVQRRLSGRSKVEEYEVQLIHKDGHAIDARVRGVKCSYAGQPAVLGTLVNITNRLRAEADLRDYRRIVQAAPIACLTVDSCGFIITMNQKCADILNTGYRKAIGRQMSEFLAGESVDLTVNGMLAKCDSNGEFKGKIILRTENIEVPAVVDALALRDARGGFRGMGAFIQPE